MDPMLNVHFLLFKTKQNKTPCQLHLKMSVLFSFQLAIIENKSPSSYVSLPALGNANLFTFSIQMDAGLICILLKTKDVEHISCLFGIHIRPLVICVKLFSCILKLGFVLYRSERSFIYFYNLDMSF